MHIRKYWSIGDWELLYADDLVVIADIEDDLIKRLNERKDNMENRGITVNIKKIKLRLSLVGMADGNAEVCKMAKLCLW